MWVRGLKQERGLVVFQSRQSHPMWVRGLKRKGKKNKGYVIGRTLCGCVD